MKKKSSSKNFLLKNLEIILFFVFAILIATLSIIGIFEKWDLRFYDALLHIKKQPEQSSKIVYAEIDDMAIHELGTWPWSRDIIGNCLLHLKELGANTTVFDIEYLSPSKKGIKDDIENAIQNEFELTTQDLVTAVEQFSSGVKANYNPDDIKEQIINEQIYPSMGNLENLVFSGYQDYDEYFARALQFFDNAWITVNTRNVMIPENDTEYVRKKLLLSNVTDNYNKIPKDNIYNNIHQEDLREPGFSPALPIFTEHAKGLGFCNANVDADGSRRRMELLYKVDDKYAVQLVLAPLLNYLDAHLVERDSHKIILHGIQIPGSNKRENLSIPVDNHGRLLINWVHKDFASSFNHISLFFLNELETLENNIYNVLLDIVQYANFVDINGDYLPCYVQAKALLDEYNTILEEKEYLLSLMQGYNLETENKNPITEEMYEHYFGIRKDYFAHLTSFRASRIEDEFLSFLGSIDFISDEDKESLWNLVIGEFSSDEIAHNIKYSVDNIINPSSDEENIDTNRFGLITDLYFKVDQFNAYTDLALLKGIKDSFCIIGETASSTTDMGATPFVNRYPNIGTHANVANTILQKDFIYPIEWFISFAVVFVFFGLVLIISNFMKNFSHNLVNGIAFFIVLISPILLMLIFSLYSPVVSIYLFSFLTFISGVGIRYIASSKEKAFIRHAFSTYVSKDVVNELISHPENLTLGGEEVKCTALFSDIKSFSSFSELVTPSELVRILNEYLGSLSDVILSYNGTIDKYIGDSIVSMFGAPIRDSEHAFKACCAAVKMKQAEVEFNKKHMIDGDIPRELFTRIGINTGEMVVGNMGTELKMNYTMMGDNVNLASRLEGANKAYNSWILISEKTWNEANAGKNKDILVGRRLDRVRVVGIEKPVQLYNVMGYRTEMSNTQIKEVFVFHEALDKYLSKEFEEAYKLFLQANELVPSDGAPLIFAERCKNFMANGVPENWEGIYSLTSK